MLHLKSISKTFSKNTPQEVRGLSDVTLSVNRNEFMIIIGANGSGKSTLLNAVSGSVLIDSGSIEIEGIDVTGLKDYERSRWISRIFQNPLSGTAPDLTIIENFRLAALRSQDKLFKTGVSSHFRKQLKEKVERLRMGLENKLDTKMGNLSGGQRQALTLLMSVMDTSKILLLDEPTSALDPKSAELVMHLANQLIAEYNLTAILITHNMKDAYTYGTAIIQMQEGKIIRQLNSEQKGTLVFQELYQWFE